jgi:hypothetical protein
MTGGREIVQVGMSSAVPALQPALSGVRQDLRPDALGFTRNESTPTVLSPDCRLLDRGTGTILDKSV